MDGSIKTKDISLKIGVNPTTVQRWTKYFNIRCEQNELGHYFYTEEQVKTLLFINQQLKSGKKMKEIQLDQGYTKKQATPQTSPSVSSAEYQEKLHEMMTHIQEIDAKLSQKADEVVSYQLLKHRSEMDEMSVLLKRLENRLIRMEACQSIERDKEDSLPMASGGTNRKGWKTFLHFFSF
ncbi:chromosome-anchoring protein RacA [Alkalicoccobacillus plakortidis]|uniref:Chromosome-anchoring protein RacA n=1 Tax=Alkalicoccobacillus plakortidis TaxID=444060 RepID=A0ABT0XEQ4_9BACI|nr:chromosome-anchoring protein RacA [Alkalicoccobacillus plakortidis]MCM2674381.1 chromosome-anchoring protein RacA [Alkalicoccobacillus plakortidis]